MKGERRIIQIQQFDKDVPIEFFRIEDTLEWFDYKKHYQSDFYQIYWFVGASNHYHEIDFVRYPIASGQVWIIYPGQVHHIDPSSITGYCLAIAKNYFHRILFKEAKKQSFVRNSQIQFEVNSSMEPILEHLHLLMEIEFNGQRRLKLLEKYVQLFIIHLQDLPEMLGEDVHIDLRTHKLLELIEEHYIQQRQNEFYADKIALSIKRMNEILIQSVGKTLKEQLKDRLLLESKRLVGYSNESIQSIAHQLHFSEVSYFNRFFKKHTHLTPMDFREKVKKVQV